MIMRLLCWYYGEHLVTYGKCEEDGHWFALCVRCRARKELK